MNGSKTGKPNVPGCFKREPLYKRGKSGHGLVFHQEITGVAEGKNFPSILDEPQREGDDIHSIDWRGNFRHVVTIVVLGLAFIGLFQINPCVDPCDLVDGLETRKTKKGIVAG